MSHQEPSASPLDQLAVHYDDEDLLCPACGYEDREGHWHARTDGERVVYRHACPSCGAVERRSIRLD